MASFSFRITHADRNSRARAGVFRTPHGVIHTPAFIPVGTHASVRGLAPSVLNQIGVEAVLANTYHLMLRPGADVVAKLGGLHEFMRWPGPIITDSGGFQAFSLGAAIEHGVGKIASIFPDERPAVIARAEAASEAWRVATKQSLNVSTVRRLPRSLRSLAMTMVTHDQNKKSFVRITERGVEFRSHLDGSKHLLTPEKSIEVQEKLGADIVLAFDECTSPLATRAYTEHAMERTHRWAVRSLEAKTKSDQALFGIVQGGEYRELREKSARFIAGLPFAGFAIGGSLGKSKRDMHQILDWTIPLLPENKPRHLLGIGGFDDIVEAIARGIDWFDCVAPTRLARRKGTVFTSTGNLNVTQAKFKKDRRPIEADCPCPTCRGGFSRAYLRHLIAAQEPLAVELATAHNLNFMTRFMARVREAIAAGRFASFRKQVLRQTSRA
ncbi:tRNA guanosine(34) transglycosylase Tgt [Candidatus Parcubacteria bacterium]|nr:tRNA guanosine(34) transglycosylase Tgt [Candidatus Parcubacteria bacterium]